jgi:hypothetical protein
MLVLGVMDFSFFVKVLGVMDCNCFVKLLVLWAMGFNLFFEMLVWGVMDFSFSLPKC